MGYSLKGFEQIQALKIQHTSIFGTKNLKLFRAKHSGSAKGASASEGANAQVICTSATTRKIHLKVS